MQNRVTVYDFTFANLRGETIRSLRPATRETIDRIQGGRALQETARQIEDFELDEDGFGRFPYHVKQDKSCPNCQSRMKFGALGLRTTSIPLESLGEGLEAPTMSIQWAWRCSNKNCALLEFRE